MPKSSQGHKPEVVTSWETDAGRLQLPGPSEKNVFKVRMGNIVKL